MRDVLPPGRVDEAALDDLGPRQRLVVDARAGRRLRRRRDDRLGQPRVLAQPVGEVVAVDRAGAGRVRLPQRRRRDAGDVAAHDDLDGQRRGGPGDEHVRVGHRDDVVGDDVGRAVEPPRGQLVEHLALERDAGEDAVERGEPVGRHEQPLAGRPRVGHAHLAVAAVGQRQVDVDERRALEHGRARSLDMADRRFEQAQAERPRRRRVVPVAGVLAGDDVVLGVRHQAEHDAGLVADPGDVGDRAVRVAADVAQGDLSGGGQAVGVGVDVAALAVGDRAVDVVVEAGRPDRAAGRRPASARTQRQSKWPPALCPSAPGQQAGAGQHLEPVADADDRTAAGDERRAGARRAGRRRRRSGRGPACARRRARRRS